MWGDMVAGVHCNRCPYVKAACSNHCNGNDYDSSGGGGGGSQAKFFLRFERKKLDSYLLAECQNGLAISKKINSNKGRKEINLDQHTSLDSDHGGVI